MSKKSNLEFNKLSAAILLAGVLAMFSGLFASIIYHVEEPEKRGFSVEVASENTDKPVKEVVPISVLLETADAAKGAKVSKKCASCHSFNAGGAHKTGPNLFGIIGKDIASIDDFSYSKALENIEGAWTNESLAAFLANPKKFAKGTKMSFGGLKKPQQIADLIKYIESVE